MIIQLSLVLRISHLHHANFRAHIATETNTARAKTARPAPHQGEAAFFFASTAAEEEVLGRCFEKNSDHRTYLAPPPAGGL